MKKSALAIILLIVFPIIITGCATDAGQATAKTQQGEKANTVVSVSNHTKLLSSIQSFCTHRLKVNLQESLGNL